MVATDQLAVAKRLDELHQLLYTRGGIRPSNAAVEELTKLLLIRIASEQRPDLLVRKHGRLDALLDPDRIRQMPSPAPIKDAFAVVNALPDFGGRVPGDGIQPVWPKDEPLRISRCDVLAEALDILLSIPLGAGKSFDPVGTAFDVFLRGKFEHAGGLGTYLTPHSVVDAMTETGFSLVNPLEGWTGEGPVMGDPCCGSGRFLIAMVEATSRLGLCHSPDQLHHLLVGADQSPASIAMARVNLLAFGLPPAEVVTVEDSVTDPSLDRLEGRLRLILTNPPFGDGKYDSTSGIARTGQQLPGVGGKQRIDPALAFVARCVSLLAPDGVAGIILPDGVADGVQVRSLLLEERLFDPVRVEGVISLPSATFAPAGTTAKTSVVFLRKRSQGSNHRVFLARADHVGHVMRKGAVAPDPDGDDLPRIAAAVQSTLKSRRVPRTLKGQLLTLSAEGVTSLDASTVDLNAVETREKMVEEGGVPVGTFLMSARKRRADYDPGLPFVSVLHVDELGNVDWLQAASHRPVTPGVLAESGQLIVSLLNPAKFRAAVVPEMFPRIQCSSEFGVFESSINPYAALALLQHPSVRAQIAPLGRGTSSSRRRIDSGDVLNLIAPPFDESWIEKTAERVAEALAAVAGARVALREAYGE